MSKTISITSIANAKNLAASEGAFGLSRDELLLMNHPLSVVLAFVSLANVDDAPVSVRVDSENVDSSKPTLYVGRKGSTMLSKGVSR